MHVTTQKSELEGISDEALLDRTLGLAGISQGAVESLYKNFHELLRRYNEKKNECEELRDAHNEVLQELNNKKKECEELREYKTGYDLVMASQASS